MLRFRNSTLQVSVKQKQIELAESYRKEEYNKFKKQSLEAGKTEQEVDDILNITNQILKNLAIHNNKTIGYVLQKMGGLPNVVKAVSDNEIIGNFATNNVKSTEENEVKIFYQNNPEIEKNINEVINSYKHGENNRKDIGNITDWQLKVFKENGLNVNENTKHRITTDFLKHKENRHGLKTEQQNNQIPVSDKDIKNIPYVINNPDYIEIGNKTKKGLPSIKYIKTISKGITYYVEEVLNDKNILESKTIYRKRTGGDTTNKGGNYQNTLKAPNPYVRDGSSKVIVQNPHTKVKNNDSDQTVKIKRVATADKLISPRSSNPITMINDKDLNVNNLNQEFNNQPLGQYNTTTNIITLFEKSNPSTLIHEMGHFFLSSLKKIAPESIIAKNYLNDCYSSGKLHP